MVWHFPLPRTHTGILLGNGTQGLMVWGGERLHVTVGRAGFWDHRGGVDFTARTDFVRLRAMLEAGDEAGVRAAFARGGEKGDSVPDRSRQIGCGRIEIAFSGGLAPVRGELDIRTATLVIFLADGSGGAATATVRQAMDEEIAWIDCECIESVTAIPTWEYVGAELAETGCVPPERWGDARGGGFCQTLPADDPLALAWAWRGSRVVLATVLGPEAACAAKALAADADVEAAAARARAWWRQYWSDVPELELPDAALQHAWDYGVYKQAGLTTPGAVPATLQGPWMEEYQIPPWSNDYHFNINVQCIYWPAFSTNRLGHFQPLWDMVASWLPRLRENASRFFGVEGALMLPHAVDDRCKVVGAFWTGTIDHACTAWVAQMAWLHYRYSMDEGILRTLAWPMLTGAFNGFWAMLEEVDGPGGKRYSLPVSVSPEFGGAGMDAWGRDASFQLAACHFLVETLPRAARILGEAEDPRWDRVRSGLPQYTISTPRRGIALWEGRDFDESHRHHSHLAAIYPFRTIDPADPAHWEVVARSIENWTALGAGAWTGWCVPWASILCSRCGLADAAVVWLRWWKQVFTNIGHGTLHDADFAGAGGLHGGMSLGQASKRGEIAQMDAGLGAVTAIVELLVQCRGDEIDVLPQLPRGWRELRFDGIRTEGAFLIGATVAAGRVAEVRVKSLAGAPLKLAHGLGEGAIVNGERVEGRVFSSGTEPGGEFVLRPA